MVRPASDEAEAVSDDAAPQAPSDLSLLVRIRRGQEDAATTLYLRYAARLRALAVSQCSSELTRRVEPDDIVQSVFRTFFRRVSQGRYDVPAGQELWRLFLVIAINKIREAWGFHRAAKRDVRRSVEGQRFELAMEAESGPDDVARATLRMVIDDVLADLPASHRQIVELRIEEHDVASIAGNTKRSKRTVERVLQQFRDKLGAVLHEHEGE